MRIVRALQKLCKCFFMKRKIVQGKTPRARLIFRDFGLTLRRFTRSSRCKSHPFEPQRISYLAITPAVYANLSACFLL